MVLNKFRLNSTIWIDVLLNVLGGILGILFLIYLLINEPIDTKKIDAVAEVIITADWPSASKSDIDLWILMPNDQAVGYTQKQVGEVSLERDDLGMRENTVVDGEMVPRHVNHETLFLRGVREGQYVVNVHYYTDRGENCTESSPQCDKNPAGVKLPSEVPVVVQIIRVTPAYRLVHSIEIMLPRAGVEKTAFRFFVDRNGKILGVSDDKLLFVLKRKGQGTISAPTALDDPQGNNPITRGYPGESH